MSSNKGHVCIGGTFSPIHSGHMLLLEEAFFRGGRVSVGLTSDEMAVRTRDRKVAAFDLRKERLDKVLSELSTRYDVPYSISRIYDRFGFATRPEIDSIVVSEETSETVDEIDEERNRNGLPPLKRFIIPIVGAMDGKKISSTRISTGEIDAEGNLLKKPKRSLCIHTGSKNNDKAQGLLQAFRRHASSLQLFKYDVSPTVKDNEQATLIRSARSRSRQVMDKNAGGRISSLDYFVGIESGMLEIDGSWFLFHCCSILNDDREGIGLSSGLEVPGDIIDNIMIFRGTSFETQDIQGNRRSLVENLSSGSIYRSTIVEECCRMALLSLSNIKASRGAEN